MGRYQTLHHDHSRPHQRTTAAFGWTSDAAAIIKVNSLEWTATLHYNEIAHILHHIGQEPSPLLDNVDTFPMSDAVRATAALQAAQRAKAIAISQEFDGDAVRVMLQRAKEELNEASTAAGLDEEAAA
jgi:hypothetical protein